MTTLVTISDEVRIVFSVCIFIIVGWGIGHSMGKFEARELIAECEQSLPRTQHCKLMAVPVDEKNHD